MPQKISGNTSTMRCHGTAIVQDFAVVVSENDITADKFDPALYHAILKRLTAIDYTIGLGQSAI